MVNKKILAGILLLKIVFQSLSAQAIFNRNFKVELLETTAFEGNSKSLTGAGGGKFSWDFGNFCFYKNSSDCNFGVTVTSEKLNRTFPVFIQTGNLSGAGALSRLNNPLLSSYVSPFITFTGEAQNLTVSLPSYSSYSKPVSLFCQGGFDNACFPGLQKFLVNSFYSPEQAYFCSSVYAKGGNKTDFSWSVEVLAGFFRYDKNSRSSWFNYGNFYYGEGSHMCGNVQGAVKLKKINSLFIFSFYNSPFNKAEFTYRTENCLKTEHFKINFSAFLNPYDNLLTSSGQKTDSCIQLKGGINYINVTGKSFPVFITSGLSAYYKYTFGREEPELKNSLGFKLNSSFMSLSVTCGLYGKIDFYNESAAFVTETLTGSIKSCFFLTGVMPYVSASVNCASAEGKIGAKITEKLSSGVDIKGKWNVSAAIGVEANQKNGELKGCSGDCSLKIKTNYRNLQISYRFSASYDFVK